ncbi:hypothetical protein L6R52_42030, partial [Myxococcota bacterium]|nr:hypothetical protein [Myxococcota bacterium]
AADAGAADAGAADAGDGDAGAPATTAELVGQGLYYPDWLVVDGPDLFATGWGVTRINRATFARDTIIAWSDGPNSAYRVLQLAVDATDVYAFTGDEQAADPQATLRTVRVPRGAGMPVELVPQAAILTVDAASYYYYTAEGVYRAPKAGGPADRLCDLPALGLGSPVMNASFLFGTGGDGQISQLYKVPLVGGSCSVPIANSSPGPATLLLDGQTLYWGHNATGAIEKVTLDGVVTPWVRDQYALYQLAQDADFVYWATITSAVGQAREWAIRKASKSGNGTPITLLERWPEEQEIKSVAVDDRYVYFGTGWQSGTIHRVPK